MYLKFTFSNRRNFNPKINNPPILSLLFKKKVIQIFNHYKWLVSNKEHLQFKFNKERGKNGQSS